MIKITCGKIEGFSIEFDDTSNLGEALTKIATSVVAPIKKESVKEEEPIKQETVQEPVTEPLKEVVPEPLKEVVPEPKRPVIDMRTAAEKLMDIDFSKPDKRKSKKEAEKEIAYFKNAREYTAELAKVPEKEFLSKDSVYMNREKPEIFETGEGVPFKIIVDNGKRILPTVEGFSTEDILLSVKNNAVHHDEPNSYRPYKDADEFHTAHDKHLKAKPGVPIWDDSYIMGYLAREHQARGLHTAMEESEDRDELLAGRKLWLLYPDYDTRILDVRQFAIYSNWTVHENYEEELRLYLKYRQFVRDFEPELYTAEELEEQKSKYFEEEIITRNLERRLPIAPDHYYVTMVEEELALFYEDFKSGKMPYKNYFKYVETARIVIGRYDALKRDREAALLSQELKGPDDLDFFGKKTTGLFTLEMVLDDVNSSKEDIIQAKKILMARCRKDRLLGDARQLIGEIPEETDLYEEMRDERRKLIRRKYKIEHMELDALEAAKKKKIEAKAKAIDEKEAKVKADREAREKAEREAKEAKEKAKQEADAQDWTKAKFECNEDEDIFGKKGEEPPENELDWTKDLDKGETSKESEDWADDVYGKKDEQEEDIQENEIIDAFIEPVKFKKYKSDKVETKHGEDDPYGLAAPPKKAKKVASVTKDYIQKPVLIDEEDYEVQISTDKNVQDDSQPYEDKSLEELWNDGEL